MMRFQRFIITCCCLLVLQSLGSAFTIPQRSVPRLAVITKQQATPRSKLLLLWMSNKNDDVQPISNDNNDPISNSDNPISRAASKCLVFLWRGMTLPFPMLRISQKASSGANNSIQTSTTFSLRECLFAIVAYLSLGAVAYTRVFERWSLIDALYFSVVSFSTVGYGDVCPTNLPSKIFTCIFGLAGVAFLGIAIATIGTSLVEAEMEAAKKMSSKRFMHVFDNMPQVVKKFRATAPEENDADTKKKIKLVVPTEQQAPESYWLKSLRKNMLKFVPSFSLLLIGGTIMGHIEGWSWPNSIYYSIITAATLGYGDFSPASKLGRMVAILFIPIAVAAAGEILGAVATILVERRQHLNQNLLLKRELDLGYLKEMDEDANGEVSRFEYITFMLQAMGVVDKELLQELNNQFDRLDVCKDGILGIEDLKLMAELKGLNVKR